MTRADMLNLPVVERGPVPLPTGYEVVKLPNGKYTAVFLPSRQMLVYKASGRVRTFSSPHQAVAAVRALCLQMGAWLDRHAILDPL